MDSPQRGCSAMVRRQNCSLTRSSGLPIRVVMGISRIKSIASGKCYQSPQDGVRYTVTHRAQREQGPYACAQCALCAPYGPGATNLRSEKSDPRRTKYLTPR
jgi:hypothetical protein